MSTNNKLLSLQEVEKLVYDGDVPEGKADEHGWACQLLDTMRENEFLRDTLTIIDMQAMNVMQDDAPPYGSILRCGWVHEKCKEALKFRKDSDNA